MSIEVYSEDGIRVVKVGPMGPSGNNAYFIRDTELGESLLVDMPLEESTLLEAIAADGGVRQIVATHWHPDHWVSYDAVRAATTAPVLVGDREIRIDEDRIDRRIADNEELRVGRARVTVLHTPGHTPGSICLRVGGALISGDTLFRGGPGRTAAAGDLETLIDSIVTRLHPLGDHVVVLPGHGEDTTIGEARGEYAEYRKHPHRAGYFGDVEWLRGGG